MHRNLGWKSLPFFAVHIGAVIGVVVLGWSWAGLGLAIALYYLRMFGITAGNHRYFAHRSYKMGRGMQFFMALLGTTSVQKGVLWWAAHHRTHHKYSDEPEDIHSVRQRGFWWAHVGWILSDEHEATDWKRIQDFARYPELVWLNRYHLVVVVAFAALLFALGGAFALVWGFFVSTTILWHGTFTINSLSHVFGRRRYQTSDDSKNNWLLALITMGEGWHNNHHHYQRSTSQGFFWWEYDATFYLLRGLSWLRLVRDLHVAPDHIRLTGVYLKCSDAACENSRLSSSAHSSWCSVAAAAPSSRRPSLMSASASQASRSPSA
jgi:stearoyl-CoA desaturase (delta-9 desaturase)